MIDGPRACRASEFEEVIALINQVFRAGDRPRYLHGLSVSVQSVKNGVHAYPQAGR